MSRAWISGLLALVLSGCGVGLVQDGSDDTADSQADLSIDFTYDCAGYGASAGQQLGLHLKGSKATVSGAGFQAVGSRDTHYHPPAGSTDSRYKRFTGWTGAPASPSILVSRSLRQGGLPLRSGGQGGFLTAQYDASSADTFICRVPQSTPAPEVPIAYVLQWINDYQGTGQVSRLNLNRDGTYAATVRGQPETGVFTGPRSPTDSTNTCYAPIPLSLVAEDGTAWAASIGMYSGQLSATRGGTTDTLSATLPQDSENACDSGGGSYADDDAVGCMFCTCPGGPVVHPQPGRLHPLSPGDTPALRATVPDLPLVARLVAEEPSARQVHRHSSGGTMVRGAVVAAWVAVVSLGPAAAWAGTLDQQQSQTSNAFSEVTGPNGQGPATEAQTFTAGLTGLLDQVDLYLEVFTGSPNPMTVEIHDVDLSGAPGPNVLASTSIAPVATTDWFSLQFTSPASVTAGTRYAIVAYTTGDTTWGWGMITSGDPYPAGAAYHSPLQPIAWAERTGADQAFRTYVAQQQADLALDMTGPNMASSHSTITYTLHVTNNGPDVARSTVLTDNLPSGVQFTSANASQGTCTAGGGIVTCALGDIASGGTANVVIQIAQPTTAIINNFASVSSNAADPDATNNIASFATRLTK